jgi:hypothetical protein
MTVAVDAEISVPKRCLHQERDHVLGAVEGLSDEALGRPVLPSGWSCLGMVRHLNCRWSACTSAPLWPATRRSSTWSAAKPARGRWIRPCRPPTSLTATAARCPWRTPPSPPHPQMPTWRCGPFPEGEWRSHSLRDVLLQVITGTARHAGHLDTARELIDGQRWLVNTWPVAPAPCFDSLAAKPGVRQSALPVRPGDHSDDNRVCRGPSGCQKGVYPAACGRDVHWVARV